MSEVMTIFGGDDFDLGNNVQVDELESDRQTILAWYIDKSGSMRVFENIMPSCIDIVLNAIKNSKSEDEFLISLTQFNEEVNRSGYKMVKDIDNSYHASGMTALYNAIVAAQLSLVTKNKDGYIDDLKKNCITTKGIFIIMTDGKNEFYPFRPDVPNFKAKDAREAVEYMNKREIITVYIAFSKEAHGIGKDLGFQNVLEADKLDEKSLRNIFSIASKSIINASKNAINPQEDDFFCV